MAAEIAGLPFWELTFDEQGDPDGGQRDAFLAEVPGQGHHGRHRLRPRLEQRPPDRDGALHAVLRPARAAGPAGRPREGRAGGRDLAIAALVGRADPGLRRGRRRGRGRWSRPPFEDGGEEAPAADPTLDPATLKGLKTLFPAAAAPLDAMAALLKGPADGAALAGFHRQLGGVLPARRGRHPGRRRGRQGGRSPAGRRTADAPRRPHRAVRAVPGRARGERGDTRRLGRRRRGVRRRAGRPAPRREGGAAPGDVLADEEPRRNGRPQRARAPCSAGCPRASACTSSATASAPGWCRSPWPELPAGAPSPVRAVTLLQGAFSHFAFASPLPFDAGRSGALAGMLARINGPLVACFSSHDGAVGTFYPLASFAAREDAAAADDALVALGRDRGGRRAGRRRRAGRDPRRRGRATPSRRAGR